LTSGRPNEEGREIPTTRYNYFIFLSLKKKRWSWTGLFPPTREMDEVRLCAPVVFLPGTDGLFGPESVVFLNRNRWSFWAGIGGLFRRNTQLPEMIGVLLRQSI
jgi:hypothetical protein